MDRIENVDLREALDAIARNNTFFHRECDLGVSLEQMERAEKQKDYMEKTLIWISYPSGIDCYTEREVFQEDTRGYNGVLYHGKDTRSDRTLAYAVDVAGVKDGRLFGSLYETDIREYAKGVHANATPSNTVRMYDMSGSETVMPWDEFNRRYPLDLVKLSYWRHEPDDPSALKAALDDIWNNSRDGKHTKRDIWAHTSRLYDERDAFYASGIMKSLNQLHRPNSPDNQFYAASLDGRITSAFDPEQLGRLLDRLPYKSAEFSIKRGQTAMYVIVPCDEIRLERMNQEDRPTAAMGGNEKPVSDHSDDKPVPPDKPSILEALKQGAEMSRQQGNNNDKPKKSNEKGI